MRINQVEQLVGITKGNIRFYEKEGLLSPGRNSENGYREYTQADVVWLKKVRLLRMLDVPIEEILAMRSGELSLSDVMARHLSGLEQKKVDLTVMEDLCREICDRRCALETLDADSVLEQMEHRAEEGTRFMNVEEKDKRRRYLAPIIAAVVMLVLMSGITALIIWGVCTAPESAPPLWLVAILAAVPIAVIVGVLLALVQRLEQIKRGEENDASQY